MAPPARSHVRSDHRLSIDLAQTINKAPPSYIGGRTFLRDEIVREKRCSAIEAEAIVDRLERSGEIYFEPERAPSLPDRGRWCARSGVS